MMGDRNCVLLFGSLARGDSSNESDIDILVAAPKGRLASVKEGAAEIQHTPQEKLLEMANRGDLFAIHLAYEAKVISDPSNFFQDFKFQLTIRRDYSKERQWAFSLLAYLLTSESFSEKYELRNKRIAWCVRTVLISLLIERGRIIFSPAKIAKEYPAPFVGRLISLRRNTSSEDQYLKDSLAFLKHFDQTALAKLSTSELEEMFIIEQNEVALATVKALYNRSGNIAPYLAQ